MLTATRFVRPLSFLLVTGAAVAFAACGGDDNGGGTGGDDSGAADSGSSDTGTESDGDHGLGDSSVSEGGRDRDSGLDSSASGQYLGTCTTTDVDANLPADCTGGYVCHYFRGRKQAYCTETCPTAGCPAPSPQCGGDGFCALP